MSKYLYIFFMVISFIGSAQFTLASEKECTKLVAKVLRLNTTSYLHNMHRRDGYLLANQEALSNKLGTSSCGPVCAINIMQAMRVYNNKMPFLDPYYALEQLFNARPDYYEDNFYPNKLHNLLFEMTKSDFTDMKVKIKTVMLEDFVHSRHAGENVKLVQAYPMEKLKPKSNEFKVLSYFTVDQHNQVQGTDYIVVKSVKGYDLEVVDPYEPEKIQLYELHPVLVNDLETVELIPDPTHSEYELKLKGYKFYIYSQTTVSF